MRELLKLTDQKGFIDLGTSDVAEMANVLKRSLGGDRYDLKAMRKHLPLLIDAKAFVVDSNGIQAGEWAGYELPAQPEPTPQQPPTDSIPASYELVRNSIGASYVLHTGSIEQPNHAESLAAAEHKERNKETHIQTRAKVSGFKAREIFIDVFAKWRAHHKCEWAPGRKDYARIDEVSLKLIPVSSTRGIPYRKVVVAALRGYTQTDAQEKRYSLAWFARDASAYLTPRSFEKSARVQVREQAEETPEDRMTYSEAVKAGLIDPSKSSILKTIGN